MVALGIAPATAAPPDLRDQTWQILDGARGRVYSMPFDGDDSASTDPGDDAASSDASAPRRVM